MHLIIDILISLVFMTQFILLCYLLYINHKRYKQDKEFYEYFMEQKDSILNELDLTQQRKVFDLVNSKENQLNEQRKEDKSL